MNDGIADCLKKDDEIDSLILNKAGMCKSSDMLPCIKGSPACFYMKHLCSYEIDSYGVLSFCRNGAHLQNCGQFNCSSLFKCPGSY